MSWFDGLTIREGDNVGVQGSPGAIPTFAESFSASYDEVTRTWAQFGMEQAFYEIEEENSDRIFELTGERPPSVVSYAYYTALARAASGHELSEKDLSLVRGMSDRIARLNQLQAQHPEVMNYGAMWNEVQRRAQEAEGEAGKLSSLRPWGTGSVGSFAGSVAGSFTYRDPLNLLTLGAGGIGRTIGMRLATEFGVQSGIETFNQVLGVQEKRELMGLESGFGQAALAIATVGAGGALIRGVGEGAGASARALLRRASTAREASNVVGPPPHGSGRTAEGVHRAELEDAARHLDTPLFADLPAARGFVQSLTSVERLASRESDAMFAGVGDERPIVSVIGRAPSERSTIFASSDQRIRNLHTSIEKLTRRIEENDAKERSVQQIVDALGGEQSIRNMRSQLTALAKKLKDTPAENNLARRRLRQERDAVLVELQKAENAVGARKVAQRRLEQVKKAGDDMRLTRAQKAAALDRSQPLPLTGRVDSVARPEKGEPAPRMAPEAAPRQAAEAIDNAQKALDARIEARALPKAAADGTIDMGDGPRSAATEIVDVDTGVARPLGDAVEEMNDDASLVRQMKECLL